MSRFFIIRELSAFNMASSILNASRLLLRAPSRPFSTTAADGAKKAQGSGFIARMNNWEKFFWVVGVPTLTLTWWNANRLEAEHHKKPRQPFIPYSHLRLRNKPFPWGDGNHTFFHHPRYNALPDGYEVPDVDNYKETPEYKAIYGPGGTYYTNRPKRRGCKMYMRE